MDSFSWHRFGLTTHFFGSKFTDLYKPPRDVYKRQVEPDVKLDITDVYDSMTTAKLALLSPTEERSIRLKQLSYDKLSLSNIGSELGLSKEQVRQLLLSANAKFKEINCPNIMAYSRDKPIDLPCEDPHE